MTTTRPDDCGDRARGTLPALTRALTQRPTAAALMGRGVGGLVEADLRGGTLAACKVALRAGAVARSRAPSARETGAAGEGGRQNCGWHRVQDSEAGEEGASKRSRHRCRCRPHRHRKRRRCTRRRPCCRCVQDDAMAYPVDLFLHAHQLVDNSGRGAFYPGDGGGGGGGAWAATCNLLACCCTVTPQFALADAVWDGQERVFCGAGTLAHGRAAVCEGRPPDGVADLMNDGTMAYRAVPVSPNLARYLCTQCPRTKRVFRPLRLPFGYSQACASYSIVTAIIKAGLNSAGEAIGGGNGEALSRIAESSPLLARNPRGHVAPMRFWRQHGRDQQPEGGRHGALRADRPPGHAAMAGHVKKRTRPRHCQAPPFLPSTPPAYAPHERHLLGHLARALSLASAPALCGWLPPLRSSCSARAGRALQSLARDAVLAAAPCPSACSQRQRREVGGGVRGEGAVVQPQGQVLLAEQLIQLLQQVADLKGGHPERRLRRVVERRKGSVAGSR